MAQGEYKVGVSIEVTYQTPNSTTGKTVNMEVFDETHTIVAGGPTVLTEIAATGRYYGTFTPDAEGRWNVEIEVSDGTGKVVKQYAVAGHDIDDIGDAVATVDTAVSAVDSNIAALQDISKAEVQAEVDSALATYDAPTKAELDATESSVKSNIVALNDLSSGDLNTIHSGTVSALKAEIDTVDPSTGAMLG